MTFAADTSAIFADPFGFCEDATYTPAAGDPVTVRVIASRADAETDVGGARLVSAAARFLVPVAAVASPRPGDTLVHLGVTYTVQGEPTRDERRLFWRIDTRAA